MQAEKLHRRDAGEKVPRGWSRDGPDHKGLRGSFVYEWKAGQFKRTLADRRQHRARQQSWEMDGPPSSIRSNTAAVRTTTDHSNTPIHADQPFHRTKFRTNSERYRRKSNLPRKQASLSLLSSVCWTWNNICLRSLNYRLIVSRVITTRFFARHIAQTQTVVKHSCHPVPIAGKNIKKAIKEGKRKKGCWNLAGSVVWGSECTVHLHRMYMIEYRVVPVTISKEATLQRGFGAYQPGVVCSGVTDRSPPNPLDRLPFPWQTPCAIVWKTRHTVRPDARTAVERGAVGSHGALRLSLGPGGLWDGAAGGVQGE